MAFLTLPVFSMQKLPERLTIEPMLKSAVAKYYNVTTETLMGWYKKANLPDTGRRKMLRPVEVDQIFKALGPPQMTFTMPEVGL